MSGRFHDGGETLWTFGDEVLVRCPSCRGRAVVRPAAEDPRGAASMTCAACGLARRTRVEGRGTVTGLPVDPWFRAPLLLQAPCCGELLWAWNLRHLELLAALVGASLRERTGGRNGTLLSRLPRWMKAARHRDEVLAAIGRLRRA